MENIRDFEFIFWLVLAGVAYLLGISPLVRYLWRTRPRKTNHDATSESGFFRIPLPQTVWDSAEKWHPAIAQPFSIGATVRYKKTRSTTTPRAMVEKTFRRRGTAMVRLDNGSSHFSRPLNEISFAA